MKKSYAIFSIGAKIDTRGDGDYTLGFLYGIAETLKEAKEYVNKTDIQDGELITILPVYRK